MKIVVKKLTESSYSAQVTGIDDANQVGLDEVALVIAVLRQAGEVEVTYE